MIRGLYISASGMQTEIRRQEVIANNLANSNTAGYKRDVATAGSFQEALIRRVNDFDSKNFSVDRRPIIGSLGFGSVVEGVYTIFDSGGVRETGNPYDAAILGEGYFGISTPSGTLYTRNGSFTLDNEGFLTTSKGEQVLGKNGPIKIDGGEPVILSDGTVTVNGEEVDRLLIFDLKPGNALKVGENLFRANTPPGIVENPKVRQNFLENSNVNVVREMVEMITVMRSYEANQKTIQSEDSTLEKAVNEVGRI